MSQPPADFHVPTVVSDLARRLGLGPWRVVWLNELGGVTLHIPSAGEYLKWAPLHREVDVVAEAERLRWARGYAVVPEVIGAGSDADGQWLRTRGLGGESAVHPRWLAEPAVAARAIGAGLRRLHESLPVATCPFSWSLADRFSWIKSPADEVLIDQAPPIDRLVVCHGDACAPNTLIGPDGECAGHVDLGHLGVADRWADLAIATYSLAWNFPGDREADLLEAYGVERDDERIGYYRRLWDAT